MKVDSWYIGIAAEAFAAALFARCGYNVSVQYGANQPEYDLMVAKGDDLFMKVSVKGSQDGAWGLTQSYKRGNTYFEATDKWLEKHGKKTVFCLVQFKGVEPLAMPRVYLALPREIGDELNKSRNGNGETVLREYHAWKQGIGSGSIDAIPQHWQFSVERIEQLLGMINKAD